MATPRAGDRTHGHMQRETGTDSLHVERTLYLRSGIRQYRIRFRIPLQIYNSVNHAEREAVRVEVEALFQKMLLVALIAKEPQAETICIEETLRTYLDKLYRAFVATQWKAGNKKWLVPSSIQKNVLEERT